MKTESLTHFNILFLAQPKPAGKPKQQQPRPGPHQFIPPPPGQQPMNGQQQHQFIPPPPPGPPPRFHHPPPPAFIPQQFHPPQYAPVPQQQRFVPPPPPQFNQAPPPPAYQFMPPPQPKQTKHSKAEEAQEYSFSGKCDEKSPAAGSCLAGHAAANYVHDASCSSAECTEATSCTATVRSSFPCVLPAASLFPSNAPGPSSATDTT